MHRLQRIAPRRAQPARLDLAEGQRPPVVGDDVELAPARAVVALDDLKAAADQVLGGELFAAPAELGTGVDSHVDHATDDLLTGGSRGATILRRRGPRAYAKLEHRAAHV